MSRLTHCDASLNSASGGMNVFDHGYLNSFCGLPLPNSIGRDIFGAGRDFQKFGEFSDASDWVKILFLTSSGSWPPGIPGSGTTPVRPTKKSCARAGLTLSAPAID